MNHIPESPRERAVYVYRLHVEWPPEALNADGSLNYSWRPENWENLMAVTPALCRVFEGDYSEGSHVEFRLPTKRRFLTYESAVNRLHPFLEIGCKGWVEQSKPVEWPDSVIPST